jgi:hypothetical protein
MCPCSTAPASKAADLPQRLAAAGPADVTLDPPAPAVGFVHRRLADADLYFLANTSNVGRTVRGTFAGRTPYAESWDPMTGAIERLDVTDGGVVLTFEPHGSRVVVFRKERGAAPRATVRRETASVELRSGWMLSIGGATATAVDLPHSWADDPRTRFFSGTAIYRRSGCLSVSVAGS